MSDGCFNIDFRDIPSVPQMIKDYLSGGLESLYRFRFSKENALAQAAIKEKTFTKDKREILYQSLKQQLSHLSLSTLQQKNLEALREENTFTVVTGHQLNLFSGPSYFIYKIMQVIKTADYLSENKEGKKFVPVFWMATEDHDFAEIDHFKTFDDFYQIEEKAGDAVGRIRITDTKFVDQFAKEFRDHPFGKQLIGWARAAYTEGRNLTQATQILVNHIFSEYGLIMVDGDDPELKKEMISYFRKELLEESLYNKTAEARKLITEKYGEVQVNPRNINLFYLNDGLRSRVERAGKQYHIVDTGILKTEEEILAELEEHPERFSPNAVLRPLFQEAVLPNIIYTGGNAEVRYWLELKNYFDSTDVPFPILVPRNSFAFISEKELHKTEKLGLEVPDFFKNYRETVNKKLLENVLLKDLIAEKAVEAEQIFDTLIEHASETDVSFGNLVRAEKARQLKSYARMQKRLIRAERIKKGELYDRYLQLYEGINPGGVWQERKINFSAYYAEKGPEWLDKIYKFTDVETSQLVVVVL